MNIAVSSWSFHDELYKGQLRLDQVSYRVYDLGYRAVELQDMFLWPKPPNRLARWLGRRAASFDPQHYDRRSLLRVRLNRLRSGTRLVCWAIDSDLTAGDPDPRRAQVAYLASAIEAAHFLGAPVMRLTLGGERDDRAAFERAIQLMSSVLPVAIALGVKLALENHGGLSADPDALIEFVQHFHSPHLGVCLDFGNFESDLQTGVQKLAPYAIHVHAKSRAFDAKGAETTIDYPMCLSTLKAAKYDGAISIEYEGESDPAQGLHRTRDLIEKLW
jgi:sugar phosphate isomerase/epimerase